jgi:hypothetical protein
MDVVLQSLTQHQTQTLFVLILGLIVSILFSVYVLVRLLSYQKRWKVLLSGSRRDSLDKMLEDHFDERIVIQSAIRSIEERLGRTEELLKSSKRFLGLVRFDAFPDVGGSQSFALALFDDNGDGAILSSIVGRDICRVYCKPIVGGRSERNLSQEEQRAMKTASEGGVRTILSP